MIALVNWFVDTFMPHRHGEVRPSRKWLIFGIILLVPGAIFLTVGIVRKEQAGSDILLIVASVLLLLALALLAAYFRFRVHFRAVDAYAYRWGFRSEAVLYAAFKRLEMGYFIPLKLVRADGSSWNVPIPDHDGGLVEVLWRLRQAGIDIPDALSMQTRFGIYDLNAGHRTRRGRKPRRV
jgi:hypothetical protein